MGVTLSTASQRGKNNFILECHCGCSIIRVIKNAWGDDLPVQHAFEIWENKGTNNWTFAKKMKLIFDILFGFKKPDYELLFTSEDAEAIGKAFLSLNEK